MKTSKIYVGLIIISIAFAVQAGVEVIDFDGSGYVAGQLPPSPWFQEYDNTSYAVTSDSGYNGTQGLSIGEDMNWAGVGYELPNVLTSQMGAVKISILCYPPAVPSGWNFADFGGLQIGRGSKRYDSAYGKGLIFRVVGGSRGTYGPGSYYGTNLGFVWSPYQWHEITFELSEDWQTLTMSAGLVGETPVVGTFSWDGGDITWVSLYSPSIATTIYDNLTIQTPTICPAADLTGDCFVDLDDFSALSNWWNTACNEENEYCDGADFNTSGIVDFDDILIFAACWLQ